MKNVTDKTVSSQEMIIVLDHGYTASKAFYNRVRDQVAEIIPALQQDDVLTLEQLCGEYFWDQLNPGEPSLAGRCMVDMVRKGEFPLTFVGCEHAHPKRYKLI